MTGKYPLLTLCAVAAVVCLTTPLLGADQDQPLAPPISHGAATTPPPTPAATPTPAAPQAQPQAKVLFPGPVPGDVSQSPYLNPGLSPVSDPMVRAGWWANSVSGSAYRVGEYENWTSGPFVNIDGLWSDGCRTLDLSATMTDDSDGSVQAYYYGPNLEANVDYQAFPHNLGHDPFDNMLTPSATTPSSSIVKQDLNAGEDYAIQVQEFKANLKGQLSQDIRWRVDVFDMEKQGVRQATSVAECYSDHPPIPASTKVCHNLSQAQTIDWKTTEIKGALEAHAGALTVEYSHLLRIFNADDSTVTRDYIGGSAGALPLSFLPAFQYPYAVVDDNITNIDQVKIGLDLDDDNKFYALMLNGDTYNDSMGTNRFFNNVDARWTNNSIENLTLSTFWKQINECETLVSPANAPFADYTLPNGNPNIYGNPTTNQDTDRHSEDVGMSALWRPFGRGFGLGGLAIHAEYDYEILHRDDAIYGAPPSPGLPYDSELDQTYTRTNTFEIRPTVRWSPTFDTYVKYRLTLCEQPLLGVKLLNSGEPSPETAANTGTYNTILPEVDNLAEIGCTWLPTKELVCNATLGIEQAYTNIPSPATAGNSLPINFTENSFPYSVSLAYIPTGSKWTFAGGYADYTDLISQLITLGDDYPAPAPSVAGSNINPLQTRWGYLGEAEVFDLAATYRWSKDVKLTAAAQWTHGIDTISPLGIYPGPFPNIGAGSSSYNLTALPGYSRVVVDTIRVQAGIDWQVREHLSTFFRYQYYNFDDPTQPYETGIANGFLVGINWIH